jgi:hypothetical protein
VYYLADDTMSIHEVAERNSGLTAGKFLDRGQYRLSASAAAAHSDGSGATLQRERFIPRRLGHQTRSVEVSCSRGTALRR